MQAVFSSNVTECCFVLIGMTLATPGDMHVYACARACRVFHSNAVGRRHQSALFCFRRLPPGQGPRHHL